jgi:endonuclease/exonuclease/phosphatase family metal-dependent hydrolase
MKAAVRALGLIVLVALAAQADAQVSTCSMPDPFVSLGGGKCVNGGWLPPGMGSSASAVQPQPSVSIPVASSPSSCRTPDPFKTLGGGICVNGGWLPPGMRSTGTVAAVPQPATSSASTKGCTSPDPFISIGGGACVNGGWVPASLAPASASQPAPAPVPAPQPGTAPAPAPAPQPSSGETTVRYFDWNIHHGVGTDGACNLDRIAQWIAKSGANVVSLNEVEKQSGWCGNADEPAQLASLLRSKTGKSWQSQFAQRDGNATGQGNLILTTFAIDDRDGYQLSYSRSVARAQITVNGIAVNVFSTHLADDSSAYRSTQMTELKRWAGTFSEQRLLAGDFNAWPGAAETDIMRNGYVDGWAKAYASGVAVAYAGNEAGNTRNSRIDYVWMSQSASRLQITAARVFDVRDANGVMPSDHRPVMVTFAVR